MRISNATLPSERPPHVERVSCRLLSVTLHCFQSIPGERRPATPPLILSCACEDGCMTVWHTGITCDPFSLSHFLQFRRDHRRRRLALGVYRTPNLSELFGGAVLGVCMDSRILQSTATPLLVHLCQSCYLWATGFACLATLRKEGGQIFYIVKLF